MRNVKLKYTLVFLLSFLGASSASSAAAAVVIMSAAASTNSIKAAEKQKEIDSSRISCVPQQSSDNLWRCEDAYGNQFDNLIILQDFKNGNLKRARN